MIVCKVLRRREGLLYSINSSLCIEYRENEKVLADIGYLFAFSDAEHAGIFLCSFYHHSPIDTFEIWNAETDETYKPGYILSGLQSLLRSHVKEWWNKYYNDNPNGHNEYTLKLPPSGTVLCKDMTIRERIL